LVAQRGVTVRWINSRFRSRADIYISGLRRSVAVAGSGKHKCCGGKAAELLAMGIIWIVCPKSGRDMSTDIKTDAMSFAALRFWALTLVCPACGETHLWSHMHGTLRDQQTIH
jgi:hypothetical protein